MITSDPIQQIPIDAELANLHLRLSGDDDMQLLAHEMYLKGAVEWAESQTWRAFSARNHYYVLRQFPAHSIVLPRGKCQAVESIVYYTDPSTPVTLSGPTSTVPGTDYQEDLTSETAGIIQPNPSESWPSVDDSVIRPIVITFTAGYTPYAPRDAQVAMLMYAADRLDIATENDAAREYRDPIADRLLQPFWLSWP